MKLPRSLRPVALALLGVVLPLVLYEALVALARANGTATVMMGAVAGSSSAGLLTMTLALAFRLYTVVILPGLVVYWAVARTWAWAWRRRAAQS